MSSHPGFLYISGIFILLSIAVIIAILINRHRKRARKKALQGNAQVSKKWERPEAWGTAVAVLTLVSSTAIGVAQLVGNQGTSSSGGNGSGVIGYVDQGIPVEGRAASPSDITAPFITIGPGGEIAFQNLAGITKTITFRDWNTIVATSKVPVDITLGIDPKLNFNLSATAVRRLQYLADLMGMQDGEVALGSPAIYMRYRGDKVLAPVLIVNGLSNAVNVTNMHVTVWNASRSRKFLNANFFSEGQPLSVAAKTSLFTVLAFNEALPASFPSHFGTQSYINWQNND